LDLFSQNSAILVANNHSDGRLPHHRIDALQTPRALERLQHHPSLEVFHLPIRAVRKQDRRAAPHTDQVVRIALEPLFVAFLLAARDINLTLVQLPPLQLAIVAIAMTKDFLDPRDELDRILVDAPQQE